MDFLKNNMEIISLDKPFLLGYSIHDEILYLTKII